MPGSRLPSGPLYRADRTLERVGERVWIGGSPLRLFRVAPAGDALLDAVVRSGSEGAAAHTPAEGRLLEHLADAGAVHPLPGLDTDTAAVGIVVPVRDDPVGLDRLLDALGPGGPSGPVVVVDDGSIDAAAHAEVAARHGVAVLRCDIPGGPAAARNAGTAALSTDAVAFLDADVVPPAGRRWLAPLLAHMGDASVAAVAPRVRSLPGPGLLAAYERRCSPLDLGPDPARVAPGTRISYLPAAALIVRRSAFEEVDGFDESLRFGEDVDMVWRLVGQGYRVRYEPVVEVDHAPRSTWLAWARQRVDYGSSAAELDARHRGAVAPAVMSPWSAAVWAMALAGHPIVATGIAAGSASALPRRLPGVDPARAVRVALAGHLGAGRQLATAGLRAWWPALVAAALVSRRARRLATSVVVGAVLGAEGPPVQRAVAVLDDLAYGAGVWRGVLRRRSIGALLPRLVGWPAKADRSLKVDAPARR